MTTPSTTENVGGVPREQASEFLSGLTREDLEKIYSAGEAQQFVKGDSMLTEGGSDARYTSCCKARLRCSSPGRLDG